MSEEKTTTVTPTPEPVAPPEDFGEFRSFRAAQDKGEAQPPKKAETPSGAKGEKPTAGTAADSEIAGDIEQVLGETVVTGKPPEISKTQRRINQLTREKHELAARVAALEKQPVEVAAGGKPAENAADKPGDKEPVEPADKPKPEDFASYEEFAERLIEWKTDQADKAKKAEKAKREAKEAHDAVVQAFQDAEDALKIERPDYDELLAGAQDVFVPDHLLASIWESDRGPELNLYLAEPAHRAEFEALAKLGPLAASRALGRIEAKLPARKAASAPNPADKPVLDKKPVSNAPKPVARVGGAAAGGTVSLNDETLAADFQRWKRARMAQEN